MAWKPPETYNIGDSVMAIEHPKWGDGKVVESRDLGEWGQMLTVHFKSRGNQTVLTSTTRLGSVPARKQPEK
jgi:hypothetical protein